MRFTCPGVLLPVAGSKPICVHERTTPVIGEHGKAFLARTYAEEVRHDRGWIGWHEFRPVDPGEARIRTGPETLQSRLVDLLEWSSTLGGIYWAGALDRAVRRSRAPDEAASVLVAVRDFEASDGTNWRAFVWAETGPFPENWIGRISFESPGILEGPFWTKQEASRPSLEAIRSWAGTLHETAIDEALERARVYQEPVGHEFIDCHEF